MKDNNIKNLQNIPAYFKLISITRIFFLIFLWNLIGCGISDSTLLERKLLAQKSIKENAEINAFRFRQFPKITRLPDINGNLNSLFYENNEKLTVLHFWATWCVPCRAELRDFRYLQKLYQQQINFVLIAVLDSAQDVRAFSKKYSIEDFKILLDRGNHLSEKLGLDGVPATIFVDKNKTILSVPDPSLDNARPQAAFVGPREWLSLRGLRAIETALKVSR